MERTRMKWMEWNGMEWTRMKDGWNGMDKNEGWIDGWMDKNEGWMDEWTRRMKG